MAIEPRHGSSSVTRGTGANGGPLSSHPEAGRVGAGVPSVLASGTVSPVVGPTPTSETEGSVAVRTEPQAAPSGGSLSDHGGGDPNHPDSVAGTKQGTSDERPAAGGSGGLLEPTSRTAYPYAASAGVPDSDAGSAHAIGSGSVLQQQVPGGTQAVEFQDFTAALALGQGGDEPPVSEVLFPVSLGDPCFPCPPCECDKPDGDKKDGKPEGGGESEPPAQPGMSGDGGKDGKPVGGDGATPKGGEPSRTPGKGPHKTKSAGSTRAGEPVGTGSHRTKSPGSTRAGDPVGTGPHRTKSPGSTAGQWAPVGTGAHDPRFKSPGAVGRGHGPHTEKSTGSTRPGQPVGTGSHQSYHKEKHTPGRGPHSSRDPIDAKARGNTGTSGGTPGRGGSMSPGPASAATGHSVGTAEGLAHGHEQFGITSDGTRTHGGSVGRAGVETGKSDLSKMVGGFGPVPTAMDGLGVSAAERAGKASGVRGTHGAFPEIGGTPSARSDSDGDADTRRDRTSGPSRFRGLTAAAGGASFVRGPISAGASRADLSESPFGDHASRGPIAAMGLTEVGTIGRGGPVAGRVVGGVSANRGSRSTPLLEESILGRPVGDELPSSVSVRSGMAIERRFPGVAGARGVTGTGFSGLSVLGSTPSVGRGPLVGVAGSDGASLGPPTLLGEYSGFGGQKPGTSGMSAERELAEPTFEMPEPPEEFGRDFEPSLEGADLEAAQSEALDSGNQHAESVAEFADDLDATATDMEKAASDLHEEAKGFYEEAAATDNPDKKWSLNGAGNDCERTARELEAEARRLRKIAKDVRADLLEFLDSLARLHWWHETTRLMNGARVTSDPHAGRHETAPESPPEFGRGVPSGGGGGSGDDGAPEGQGEGDDGEDKPPPDDGGGKAEPDDPCGAACPCPCEDDDKKDEPKSPGPGDGKKPPAKGRGSSGLGAGGGTAPEIAPQGKGEGLGSSGAPVVAQGARESVVGVPVGGGGGAAPAQPPAPQDPSHASAATPQGGAQPRAMGGPASGGAESEDAEEDEDEEKPRVDAAGLEMTDERDRRLRDIKRMALELFSNEKITDCEALAQLVERVLKKYKNIYLGWNNDEETFVEDLTLVLTERSEDGALSDRGARRDGTDAYFIGWNAAGDSGFKSAFRSRGGGNQVRHFWASVSLGFQMGRTVGLITAAVRDLDDAADRALGYAGTWVGAGLDDFGVSLEELADVIRARLGKDAKQVK